MMMSTLHAMEQGLALGPLVGVALVFVVNLPFKLAWGIRRYGEPSTETRLLTALFYAYGVRGVCLSLILLFPRMPHLWLLLLLNAAGEYATFALVSQFFVAGVLRVAPQSRRVALYALAHAPILCAVAMDTQLLLRGSYSPPLPARLFVPIRILLVAQMSWILLQGIYDSALPFGQTMRWTRWVTRDTRKREPEPLITELGLHRPLAPTAPVDAVALPASSHAIEEQRAIKALAVGVLFALLLSGLGPGGPYRADVDNFYSGIYSLILFGILLVVLYYKGRFVFVDVFLKAIVRMGAMTLAVVAVVFPAVWLSKLFAGGQIGTLVPLIAVILFAVVWKAVDPLFGRWLDRHLFQRPNYVQVATALAREMRSRATADDAVAVTTDGLARALSADTVRLLPPRTPPGPEAAALASVALGERRFGALVFGPRVHRWPYQSEDLDFASSVARLLAETLDSIEKQREREAAARRELELRELAARAEARALRARIDPHFLFNTLNTLADLIRDDPADAERVVLDLSGVFRFALDASGRESVPVAEEVEFLRAYLDIESLRFEGRLHYEIDFPDALNDRVIPPMLIQPLVENAVRHGIAPRPEGGTVRVSVRSSDGRLTVRVEDDGVGFDVGGTAAQQGVGLANVRDRVTRFFGPDAWHLESRPGRGTLVELRLPAAHATSTAQPQEDA